MSERILIAGGTGYIGCRLAEFLAGEGYRVTVFGRHYPDPEMGSWHSMMESVWTGDIRDPGVFDLFATRTFNTVIHLIGMDYQEAETADDVLSVNTLPTWALLRHCERQGIGRMVYFSTERVMGSRPSRSRDGIHRAEPDNLHGLSHYLSEEIVAYFNEHSPVSGLNLRVSNTYGPPVFREGNWTKYVVNQLCLQAFEEGRILLQSDGSAVRDFIHIDDVCRATLRLLGTFRNGSAHPIASGRSLSILEVARSIRSVYSARYGEKLPIRLPGGEDSAEVKMPPGRMEERSLDRKTDAPWITTPVDFKSGLDDLFSYLEAEKFRV